MGEFTVMVLWVGAMISRLWQGVYRSMKRCDEITGPCPDDPTSKCYLDSDDDLEPAESTAQRRCVSYFSNTRSCFVCPGGKILIRASDENLRMFQTISFLCDMATSSCTPARPRPNVCGRLSVVAVYFGFVASCHFAVILIPVARDSKLWSAVGIPFERAVLYHVIAGHLAFATMFLHGFLFVASWVWEDGWKYAWEVSTNEANGDYGNIDVPIGWAAGLCALPMWITSVNYVRRRWYSLFKASHWLFIGVFVFGALHVGVLCRCLPRPRSSNAASGAFAGERLSQTLARTRICSAENWQAVYGSTKPPLHLEQVIASIQSPLPLERTVSALKTNEAFGAMSHEDPCEEHTNTDMNQPGAIDFQTFVFRALAVPLRNKYL